LLNPYLLRSTDPFRYEFVTDVGIVYAAYFLNYSYLFGDYPRIAHYMYSFNIEQIQGSAVQAGTDERIAHTILDVLRRFFNAVDNAVIYVCDSSDERQMIRKRKFDRWFSRYSDGSIIKEDGRIVTAGISILNALLIHREHFLRDEIIAAFRELNSGADEK
jgi:hypothetical protein